MVQVVTNARPDSTVIAAYSLDLDAIGNHRQTTSEQPLVPILRNLTNSYTYDSDNRLTSIDGVTTASDSNGNLTNFGQETLAYDFENRLVQFDLSNATGSYAYDGLGNRLARTISGEERRFVLDRMTALTQVLVETDSNGSPVAYYIYGMGLAERITPADEVASYHFDIRGSTVAVTDATGSVTDAYAFDSFGALAHYEGVSSQPFRYLGRYGVMDDDTGLCHARARYFSPQLGRFLTKDPITGKDSDGQTFNRFLYALNNPLRFRDTTGLIATEGTFSLRSSSLLRLVIVPEQAEVLLPPKTARSTLPFVASAMAAYTAPTLYMSQPPVLTLEEQQRGAAIVRGYEQVSEFLGRGVERIGLGGLMAIPEIGPIIAGVADVIIDYTHLDVKLERMGSMLAGSMVESESGRQFLGEVGEGRVLAIKIEAIVNNVENTLRSVGLPPELLELIGAGR